MSKIPSLFQRALNREIFETAECLGREAPLNTVEDVNTVKIAFKQANSVSPIGDNLGSDVYLEKRGGVEGQKG